MSCRSGEGREEAVVSTVQTQQSDLHDMGEEQLVVRPCRHPASKLTAVLANWCHKGKDTDAGTTTRHSTAQCSTAQERSFHKTGLVTLVPVRVAGVPV